MFHNGRIIKFSCENNSKAFSSILFLSPYFLGIVCGWHKRCSCIIYDFERTYHLFYTLRNQQIFMWLIFIWMPTKSRRYGTVAVNRDVKNRHVFWFCPLCGLRRKFYFQNYQRESVIILQLNIYEIGYYWCVLNALPCIPLFATRKLVSSQNFNKVN